MRADGVSDALTRVSALARTARSQWQPFRRIVAERFLRTRAHVRRVHVKWEYEKQAFLRRARARETVWTAREELAS